MQQGITHFFRRSENGDKNSVNLGWRLQMHLCVLVVVLLSLAVALIVALDLYSPQKTAATALSLQMDRQEKRLTDYFRHTAALGIHFSRQVAQELDQTLADEKATFAEARNNRALIAKLETSVYTLVYNTLRIADCSGAFVIFDTTVNSALPNAEENRSGLYLKLANINTSKPVSPEVLLARGIHEIGHNNGHIFHNKWELEFTVSRIPFYHRVLENASRNPIDCYYYSSAVEFNGTWERLILLLVPIVGEKGQVYGVCGLEINNIFFKLYHAEAGSLFDQVAGIVARKQGNAILAHTGLEFGTQEGYFAGLGLNTLTITPGENTNLYRLNSDNEHRGAEFVGLDRPLALSPLSDRETTPWVSTCLVPREEYDLMLYFSYLKLILFCVGFFALALLATCFIRQRYNVPILRGLDAIRHGTLQKTYINEIDDLMEFLATNDSPQDVDMSVFYAFRKNIKALSRAETAVFNLYMEGYSAPKIAEMLHVSINTIKSHNKSIYKKLNISSRKELMVYAQLMKTLG